MFPCMDSLSVVVNFFKQHFYYLEMAEGDDPQQLINQKKSVWSQQNNANF